NPKFCELTGYSKEEVIGNNPRILKSDKTKREIYTDMWSKLTSGEEWNGEFINKKKNGELYFESANISPVKNENEVITHYIGVKEDITAKKNTEEQLKKAVDRAEEINRIKTVFLANMSHELRTPMVGILGFTELLGREITDAAHKDMIDSVRRSGKRLMETLNLILDLSRIESEKQDMNLKPLNLFKHAGESVKLFEPVAKVKNIELNISVSEGGIVSILDERLFHGIIDNLINNALKYTIKGRIDILISLQKSKTGIFSVLHVKDTGIGIEKDRIGIIFDEFRQASEGFDRLFEGSGLGLTVTKKYVEMMNGTISVQSVFGKGSTFIVRFPLYSDSEQNTENPESLNPLENDGEELQSFIGGAKYNALVVDDDKYTHDILKVYLRGICNVNSVYSGEEALMVAGNTRYDLILLDISLGKGLSGYDVLKKIREIKSCTDVPVAALTAYAVVGDEEKFLRAGFTYYISKPFDRRDLQKAIKKILGIKQK
ncbi:MAG: hypothetical protein QG635_1725, partial [Bacteroidota bacterium]|nr:hypothetical protein [Bacteroidota bacterium]